MIDKSSCLYIKDLKNCEYLSFSQYISRRGDIFPNIFIISKK